jgi:hypothetical protein
MPFFTVTKKYRQPSEDTVLHQCIDAKHRAELEPNDLTVREKRRTPP